MAVYGYGFYTFLFLLFLHRFYGFPIAILGFFFSTMIHMDSCWMFLGGFSDG